MLLQTVHGAHTVFAVSVHRAVEWLPAAHTEQPEQKRSVVLVGAMVSYETRSEQTLVVAQTRFEVADAAVS